MPSWRLKTLHLAFLLFGALILFRLFYWQILQGEELSSLASSQRFASQEIPAPRGKIFTSDSFPLATNRPSFLVFASLDRLEADEAEVAAKLAPFLVEKEDQDGELLGVEEDLKTKLLLPDRVWVALAQGLSEETKEKIGALAIPGIGFESGQKRFYPEASMSAHLLGFVGKDVSGAQKGYFGLEGFYNFQLKGLPGLLRQEKDVFGAPILIGTKSLSEEVPGRDLFCHLNRSAQFMIEEKLKEGMRRYGAKQGSVVVMDPKTGGILAMASFPNFDPGDYARQTEEVFSNPVISETFEPGSIFKLLVMSAAIDTKTVKPEDRCTRCSGPVFVDKYVIRTWDDKYHPDSTMVEIIQNSDNVGMVFVGEKLGIQKLVSYLQKFGIGETTGIDLEGEAPSKLRKEEDWSIVDLNTASFGQGVALTGIQMVAAVGAIANEGRLMEPHVVAKIASGERVFEVRPRQVRQVISPTTAKIITEMMVNAVEKGEAKWTKLPGFRIAGKTGTAQIPIAGHYDEEKTIASFVGFAPADDPAFVMLVTLREPQVSQWASETAAPLWFETAKELFSILGLSP